MLKIAMLGWYPPTPERIGRGPEQNAYIQVQTLSEMADVQVEVVSRLAGEPGVKLVQSDGVSVHFVGQPPARIVPNTFGMVAKIAAVLSKIDYDVAVSHNFTETLAAVRVGKPAVYIVHGISRDEARHARGVERLRYWLQVKADEKAIREADEVVCISDYGMRYCRAIAGSKVHLIDYPIVEDRFFAAPPYNGGTSILSVTTLNYLKNPMAAIRAMPLVLYKHPNAKLRICGKTGDARYLADMERQIAEYGIAGSVDILGVVSRDAILKHLSDSACLVLPSRQENTPNAIAQAMAARRAVVAAPVGGVPEMIEDGVTGYLVEPDDVDTLADRIGRLLDNPSLALEMGEAAHQSALARFERHAQVDQLLRICRSTLSRTGTDRLRQ